LEEINDMPLDDGVQLIVKAKEKQEEQRAWDLYLTKYSYMDENTYIPFEDFFKPKQQKESNESVEDILKGVKESIDIFRSSKESR